MLRLRYFEKWGMTGRCRWQRILRRRAVAVRLLGLCIRIPPGLLVSVCREYCVVRSLRRADYLSSGVLPKVVRRCVWSRNLMNKQAVTRVGPQRHRHKKKNLCRVVLCPMLFLSLQCTHLWSVSHDKYLVRWVLYTSQYEHTCWILYYLYTQHVPATGAIIKYHHNH